MIDFSMDWREGVIGETANHSHYAFLGPRSCQAQQPVGKIPVKPANHGHYAFLDRDVAKTRDNPHRLGKIQGKPPIMAIWLISDRDRAKASAILRGGLGKNSAEAAIDGDHALIGPRLCQKERDPQPIGKNSRGNRQSWRFREEEAKGLVKPGGLAKTEKRIGRWARRNAARRPTARRNSFATFFREIAEIRPVLNRSTTGSREEAKRYEERPGSRSIRRCLG